MSGQGNRYYSVLTNDSKYPNAYMDIALYLNYNTLYIQIQSYLCY
jgi:hypothetical protein